MKKIGAIGIGNPLRQDDGIGLVLLEKLVNIKDELPDNIEYIDGGTGGMNLLHIISGFDVVVFLDAVNFSGDVGESRLLKIDDIKRRNDLEIKTTHSMDVLKVLEISKKIEEKPKRFFIFAVQPCDISFGANITKELNEKLDLLVQNFIKDFKNTII